MVPFFRSSIRHHGVVLHLTQGRINRPIGLKLQNYVFHHSLTSLQALHVFGISISITRLQPGQQRFKYYDVKRVQFPPRLPVSQLSSQCGFNTRPVTNQRSEHIQRLLTQNGARKSPRTIWPLLLQPCLPQCF